MDYQPNANWIAHVEAWQRRGKFQTLNEALAFAPASTRLPRALIDAGFIRRDAIYYKWIGPPMGVKLNSDEWVKIKKVERDRYADPPAKRRRKGITEKKENDGIISAKEVADAFSPDILAAALRIQGFDVTATKKIEL